MTDFEQSMIPWFGPELGEREQQLIAEAIDSNYINDGHLTRRFEASIASMLGVRHAVGVTSGTAAISLALMGLGIGHGDEVIVPDLTFIATANAVRMTGADVRLVDVDMLRFTIDPQAVAEAIGPRTRAVVPVDVNGRGADYAVIESLCHENGLFLVEDAAEALGSKLNGKWLGSFGNAGCFSFSANKTITTGQGGMVVTDDTKLYHRLLELKDQGRRQQGTGGDDFHPVLGYNFKLTNLQSAIGLAQFERLDARLDQARRRDAWYRNLLADNPDIVFPPVDIDGGEVLQWTDVLIERRNVVRQALDKARIGSRAYWHPLHTQGPYRVDKKQYFSSQVISSRGLWLPSSFSLTTRHAQSVASAVQKAIAKI